MRLDAIVIVVACLTLAGSASAACVTRTTDIVLSEPVRDAPTHNSKVTGQLASHLVISPGRQQAGWVAVTTPAASGWLVNTATELWCGDAVATARDLPSAIDALGKQGLAGDQAATDRLALAFATGTRDGPEDTYSTAEELREILIVRPRSVARSINGLTDAQARALLDGIFNSDPDPDSAPRLAFDAVVAEPAFAGSIVRRVWPADRSP